MKLEQTPYVNRFVHGRELAKKTLIGSLVCSILSLLGQAINPLMPYLFAGASAILFAATVWIVLHECRCPRCGRRIILGFLAVRACPGCRHNLITGKKEKKSK